MEENPSVAHSVGASSRVLCLMFKCQIFIKSQDRHLAYAVATFPAVLGFDCGVILRLSCLSFNNFPIAWGCAI